MHLLRIRAVVPGKSLSEPSFQLLTILFPPSGQTTKHTVVASKEPYVRKNEYILAGSSVPAALHEHAMFCVKGPAKLHWNTAHPNARMETLVWPSERVTDWVSEWVRGKMWRLTAVAFIILFIQRHKGSSGMPGVTLTPCLYFSGLFAIS